MLSQIAHCNRCPRLRNHCKDIATTKRKAFLNETYWGKPVAGFGDPNAQVMIVGLAPAAHGANRTGRIFTGDRSGDWLYRALYKVGLANQPKAVSINDGLKLKNTYITCVVHCAPPDNKPTPDEEEECSSYLREELKAFKNARIWIALGQIAMNRIWKELGNADLIHNFKNRSKPKFKHGECVDLGNQKWLLMSYHPSQQNTFTGRLTEPMFDSVFQEAILKISLAQTNLPVPPPASLL